MSVHTQPSPSIAIDLRLDREDFQLQTRLDLPAQGVTVLFGPSGSGKTSLLRCLAGLERAQGRVLVGDQLWQDSAQGHWLPTWQRRIGYVFQEASLFEHLSVMGNLRYGLERSGHKGPESERALQDAIALLGIEGLLHRRPESLSGGERQRAAIARALASQPSVLLLDEPLAALDQARRAEILPWLEGLHRALRMPMLYVTHQMQELTRLADHVVLLDRGQAVLSGPISSVLTHPRFAHRVGGEAGALLTGQVSHHDPADGLSCLALDDQQLWVPLRDLPVGSAVRVHVHANDVSLALQRPEQSSVLNVLPGVILSLDADPERASCLVQLRLGQQTLLARVTQRSVARLPLAVGQSVWMQIKSVGLRSA